MKHVKVFQIDETKDNARLFMFSSLSMIERMGKAFNADNYKKVFDGVMDINDPEDAYIKLQGTKPNGYKGHSLSVSDIVVIDNKAYFCDSFGFKDVTEIFNKD